MEYDQTTKRALCVALVGIRGVKCYWLRTGRGQSRDQKDLLYGTAHRRGFFETGASGQEGPAVQGPKGPIVSKGAHFAISLGPQPAPRGPSWDGWPWLGPLTLQKSAFGCRKTLMYPKKIHYGDSTSASKRSSGGPAESRGCIGTRCTPLATSLAQRRCFSTSFVWFVGPVRFHF